MSTSFYARKKKPREVYDEYYIGHRFNGEFIENKYDRFENSIQFNDKEDIIEFIENTKQYDFYDEYDRNYSVEDMIKVIKGE